MNVWIELLKRLLEAATPELRELILEAIRNLEEKAKETPNPIDDLLVWVLKKLLGF